MALAAADLEQEFVTLHDTVQKAIGNTTGFKSRLLGNFKSTLDSFEPRIKQRAECRFLRNPQLTEKLILQMHKGMELVRKLLSKPSSSVFINVWKRCFCKNDDDDDYVDELVELDRYFRRLLDFLWQHEEGRMIEKQYGEAKDLAGVLPKDLGENSKLVSSSNAEASFKPFEEKLVTSYARWLLDLVIAKQKSTTGMLKAVYADLESTLQSLKPFTEKIEVLHLPKKEKDINHIIALIDEGYGLVVQSFPGLNQLLELNHSLQIQLSILRKQTADDLSKELVSLRNIDALIYKRTS